MTLQGVKRKLVTVSDFRFTGRLLGKGNFARVEEAVHNILNVKVAVKVIDTREIKEKYVVKNLHREARIMSALNHPCIAALFETIQFDESVYYLVTELVAGGDLCSFIIAQRYGKLEERTARIYARQFVSALSHMHSFGIVHRDLKMENVMLNSAQTQIKIVDFGLSNVWNSDNPLRTHCGSPEYAAPELFIAGKEYGPEVDLWSLGIIFYGMVVGQLPFVSGRKTQLSSQERRKRLVAQINKGLGTSQRQAIAPLSPEFRVMMAKLLMAEPTKRITVKELVTHPWITEKGRKAVQSHPIKKLDGQGQIKLTKQIGSLLQTDQKSTITEICAHPYGRLGGMYNILMYKQVNDRFNPDHIAPAVHRNKIGTVSNVSGSADGVVTAATRRMLANKPQSAPAAVRSQRGFYNQCVVLLNKVSKQQIENRINSPKITAGATKSNTTSSSSRPTRSKVDHIQPVRNNSSVASTRKSGDTGPSQNIPLKKLTSSRLLSAVAKRTNSETAALSKRAQTAPRSTKRTSVSTATSAVVQPSCRELQRFQHQTLAAGDGGSVRRKVSNAALQRQKGRTLRDPLANDPIARSIAGYLVKNVPDKIFNLQMRRK